MKIALFSGGKDSFYASIKESPVDAYLILVYKFPYPSPHLINLGLSVMTGLLVNKPVFVKRLTYGKEFYETVEFLRTIGADIIVAGDVYIEDHLKYMERVANESGATLREPLWGMDPWEVLAEEMDYGLEAIIIGVVHELENILGKKLSAKNYERIAEIISKKGYDILGERGEYHTLVEYSPNHSDRLKYKIAGICTTGRGKILELVLEERDNSKRNK